MSPFSPIVQALKTTFIKLLMHFDIVPSSLFQQGCVTASSFLNSSPFKLTWSYPIAFCRRQPCCVFVCPGRLGRGRSEPVTSKASQDGLGLLQCVSAGSQLSRAPGDVPYGWFIKDSRWGLNTISCAFGGWWVAPVAIWLSLQGEQIQQKG